MNHRCGAVLESNQLRLTQSTHPNWLAAVSLALAIRPHRGIVEIPHALGNSLRTTSQKAGVC